MLLCPRPHFFFFFLRDGTTFNILCPVILPICLPSKLTLFGPRSSHESLDDFAKSFSSTLVPWPSSLNFLGIFHFNRRELFTDLYLYIFFPSYVFPFVHFYSSQVRLTWTSLDLLNLYVWTLTFFSTLRSLWLNLYFCLSSYIRPFLISNSCLTFPCGWVFPTYLSFGFPQPLLC